MTSNFPTSTGRRIAALLLATASGAAIGAPSTQFGVTGGVLNPRTYDAAALAALPSVTQTDTFLAGNTPQTHVYTGASLWGVLDGAGIVVGSAKNDLLNHYVLATASDGYRVVYSMGELNPGFGNRPDLIAHSETINGVATPLAADGFARVTAPGDVKGGRYLSNLVNLDVRASGSTATFSGGGVSTRFTVSGDVLAPKTFDMGALQGLRPVSQTVNGVLYTGVSFWDLLNTATGLALDPNVKNDVLGKYVVATGSDGYRTVFSLGEIDPEFGNQPDLIAFSADGAGLGSNGFARLVVPGDVKAGRWVSNLVSLEVLSATPVPEPATSLLMLGGLAFSGVWAVRRRAGTSFAEAAAAPRS